jgi:alginate O-acetyltransferase complex protein AlgJ
MPRWLAQMRWRYLPLVIGASVLLVPWFFVSWNLTAGLLIPRLHFRNKPALVGMVEEAAPALSLHAVLTGSYQHWISHTIGTLSPIFAPAIRWKSQFYYSVMGTTGLNHVVVGSQRQLLEPWFLDEYCTRDLEVLRAKAEPWVARIRQMQDIFDARGTPFLYVVTPSKVAHDPQVIPAGYTCPGRATDKADKLKVYDEILERHGVRFVDTASYLVATGKDYPIAMFPRGGTHWNSLAAALAAQKIIAALNARRRDALLATLDFTWRISYAPKGSDRDLLDLLNLPYPDAHYPVPELNYRSDPPPSGCRSIKLTEVGGSFLTVIDTVLGSLACPPEISDWFYWGTSLLHYTGDRLVRSSVDSEARRLSLLNAQAVIFEENELTLPASHYGELMMQEVAAAALRAGRLPGAGPANSVARSDQPVDPR